MHNDAVAELESPAASVGSVGAYDTLYRALGVVWPKRPGRMVRRASEMCPPAHALDAGCGDGKDAMHLASQGWDVSAFDVSKLALAGLRARQAAMRSVRSLNVLHGDAAELEWPSASFQLVVAYGLYHCLDDDRLRRAHAYLDAALAPGGLFAFAAFNNDLPLPNDHGTVGIVLRPRLHIIELLVGWKVESLEFGTIAESHLPVIGCHEHALTWGLFRKPSS
jgi:SAM-dependent methyltransferase